MAKFIVLGTVPISVSITVEADDKESAIKAAYRDFEGLSGYAGNGGSDKLIGTYQQEVSLEGDGEPEFNDAEELE
jgi:hypothetical protein